MTTYMTDYLSVQSVHIAVLFAIVAVAAMLLRRQTAHLRYLLWLLIVAKCFVPPLHTFSLPVLPERIDDVRLTNDDLNEPAIDGNHRVSYAHQSTDDPAPSQIPNGVGTACPTEEHTQAWTTNGMLAAVWAIGAAAYVVWLAMRAVRFERYVRRQRVPITADSHPAWAGFLAEAFPTAAPLRIYQLARTGQPFVWGLWRPAIYLPGNFAAVNDPHKQQSILMHEAGHILRRDPLVNFLQVVAQGLFWFHPLVWVANRILRAEREKCCDEFAVATLNTAPRSYCAAIVEALMAAQPSRPAIPTLAVAGPVKNIEDRIKTLLTPDKRFYTRPTTLAVLAVLLLAVTVVPTTVALSHRVQKPEARSQETELPIVELEYLSRQTERAVGVPTEPTVFWTPDGKPVDTTPELIKPELALASIHWPSDQYNRPLRLWFYNKRRGVDSIGISIELVGKAITCAVADNQHNQTDDSLTSAAMALVLDMNTEQDFPEYGVIKVSYAVENWKTIANFDTQRGKQKEFVVTDGIKWFYEPTPKGLKVSLQFDTAPNHDRIEYRYVLAGLEEQPHSTHIKGLINNGRLETYEYSTLKPSDLRRVQIQSRPRTTKVFENIALRPISEQKPEVGSQETERNGQNTELRTQDTAFTAVLDNGVTVELLGLCEHPSEGKPWWKPDGSDLKDKPWDKMTHSVSGGSDRKAYEIALKLNWQKNNMPGFYAHIDNVGSSCAGWHSLLPANDLRYEIVDLPKNLETTDIHFAVASDAWQTRHTRQSPWDGVYVVTGVVWQAPIAQGDKTILSMAHNFTKDENRLVAIDKQGKEHVGSGTGGSTDGKTLNMQMTFNVKLDDIKEFQLQTRPYEHYTFKNVSLRPGTRTNVEIVAEKPEVGG